MSDETPAIDPNQETPQHPDPQMFHNPRTLVDEHRADPERNRLYLHAQAELDFTETVCRVMRSKKITRKQLAKLLGWKRKRVKRMLQDSTKMRLKHMSDVMWALGVELRVTIRKPKKT